MSFANSIGHWPTIVGVIQPLNDSGTKLASYMPFGLSVAIRGFLNAAIKLSAIGSLVYDVFQPRTDYHRKPVYILLDVMQSGLNVASFFCDIGSYYYEGIEGDESKEKMPNSQLFENLSLLFVSLSVGVLGIREILFRDTAQKHHQIFIARKTLREQLAPHDLIGKIPKHPEGPLKNFQDEDLRKALYAAMRYDKKTNNPEVTLQRLADLLVKANNKQKIPSPEIILAAAAIIGSIAPPTIALTAGEALTMLMDTEKEAEIALQAIEESEVERKAADPGAEALVEKAGGRATIHAIIHEFPNGVSLVPSKVIPKLEHILSHS